MDAFEKNQYVAFTIEDKGQEYVFAVPIENIDALVPLTDKSSYIIPPHTRSEVLCVMGLYGKLITVINLLNLFGIPYIPQTANAIIVLRFLGKEIGVPAQSAHLVAASPYEMADSKSTGTKVFSRGNIQYHALNIPRLYKYLGQQAC